MEKSDLISIIDSANEEINAILNKYGEMKNSKVLKWKYIDLYRYILKKYKDKIMTTPKSGYAISMLKQINDGIKDFVGYSDPLVLKSYIDYYVKYFCRGNLNLRYLKNDSVFAKFADNFSYEDIIVKHIESSKKFKKENNNNLNNKNIIDSMKKAYLVDENLFLERYGIVLCVNYLLKFVGMDKKDIVSFLAEKLLKNKCNIDKVLLSTEKNNPYPVNMKCKNVNSLLSHIGIYKNITINVGNNIKYNVLI